MDEITSKRLLMKLQKKRLTIKNRPMMADSYFRDKNGHYLMWHEVEKIIKDLTK